MINTHFYLLSFDHSEVMPWRRNRGPGWFGVWEVNVKAGRHADLIGEVAVVRRTGAAIGHWVSGGGMNRMPTSSFCQGSMRLVDFSSNERKQALRSSRY